MATSTNTAADIPCAMQVIGTNEPVVNLPETNSTADNVQRTVGVDGDGKLDNSAAASKVDDDDDFVDPWNVESKSAKGIDYNKLISMFLLLLPALFKITLFSVSPVTADSLVMKSCRQVLGSDLIFISHCSLIMVAKLVPWYRWCARKMWQLPLIASCNNDLNYMKFSFRTLWFK